MFRLRVHSVVWLIDLWAPPENIPADVTRVDASTQLQLHSICLFGLVGHLFPEKMVSAESMAATVRASGRQCSSVAVISVRATLGSTGSAAMRRPISVMCPSTSMPPRMYSCLSASSSAGLCNDL